QMQTSLNIVVVRKGDQWLQFKVFLNNRAFQFIGFAGRERRSPIILVEVKIPSFMEVQAAEFTLDDVAANRELRDVNQQAAQALFRVDRVTVEGNAAAIGRGEMRIFAEPADLRDRLVHRTLRLRWVPIAPQRSISSQARARVLPACNWHFNIHVLVILTTQNRGSP